MTHSDPDVLAMLALGDSDVKGDDVDHAMTCPRCLSELQRLTRVIRAARENGPVDFEMLEPSPLVWEHIRTELALGAVASAATDRQEGGVAPAPRPAQPLRWAAFLSAAAVLVAAAVVALVILLQPGTQVHVQAQATLTGLPAWSTSSGHASMEREPNGTTVLAVTLDSPAVSSGGDDFREVWLMNADLTKSISVGLLSGGTGRFVMPSNVAAADYPVVDISQQPLNGNPAHSGNSIVRGTLSAKP